MAFTLDQMIHEAERELRLKRRFYPRWVREGRLSSRESGYRISVQEQTVEFLKASRESSTPTLFDTMEAPPRRSTINYRW